MDSALEEARSALKKAADDMAKFYDRNRGTAPSFKVGDKVWLNSRHINTDCPKKKFDDKWLGPYSITKVVSRNAYKLKLPPSFGRVHPVFNVSLLRSFVEDVIAERPRPKASLPVIVDGQEEYKVERILDSRIRYRRLEYLVSWKGYGQDENSWTPALNVHAPRIVRTFHLQNPQAPQRLASTSFDEDIEP